MADLSVITLPIGNGASYNLKDAAAREALQNKVGNSQKATSSTLGLVRIGYTESGKNYAVQLDNDGKMYVNVPWTDTVLSLGEKSTDAYRGDRGKTAYDHSQLTSGNPHNVSKSDVGLGNVPNVATNDQTPTFTEATTRANIASGEKVSVILGKVKKFFTDLKTVAFTGSYDDLSNKPTIPAAVAVKGNAETSYRTGNVNITPANIGLGNVGNFKAVSTVASQGLTNTEKSNARANIGAGTSSFSGSYNDLSDKPTIPTVNNATLTIQKNGTNVKTFTANASTDVTANITVPTKVSELTNDSGFTTNTGTVTKVSTGVGLTGGDVTTTGTVKAKLRSETALTLDSAAATTTSGRVYPVAVDKTGYLAVNVPWTDENDNDKVYMAETTTGSDFYEIPWTKSAENDNYQWDTLRKYRALAFCPNYNSSYGATLRIGRENNTDGMLRLCRNDKNYHTDLICLSPTANQTISLPNASGTVALTRDLPTVSSQSSSITSGGTSVPNGGAVYSYLNSNYAMINKIALVSGNNNTSYTHANLKTATAILVTCAWMGYFICMPLLIPGSYHCVFDNNGSMYTALISWDKTAGKVSCTNRNDVAVYAITLLV